MLYKTLGKLFSHNSKTATDDIEVKSNYSILDDKTLCGLLQNLSSVASRKGLNFDYPPALTDDDYYNLTGLKKVNSTPFLL